MDLRPTYVKVLVGTEAVAAGTVTRHQLKTRFVAVYRNVYAPCGLALTATDKARAAWLWSGRRATVAGVSAAALHGSLWIVQLRTALKLVDPGSESPQETRTRLVLTNAGLPPEATQIEVYDRHGYHVGRIDMGWETWKVGVEYDGAHHWSDPRQRSRDIDRQVELESLGWRIIRVSADILRDRPATIAVRVWHALQAAGAPVPAPNLNF